MGNDKNKLLTIQECDEAIRFNESFQVMTKYENTKDFYEKLIKYFTGYRQALLDMEGKE